MVGLRNPVAPLVLHHAAEGRAWADFTLGAAYEGPPGLVHGGVSALVLDQVLGDLHAGARTDRTDGWKSIVVCSISDSGGVTVEAEAIFVVPAWAREAGSQLRSFG